MLHLFPNLDTVAQEYVLMQAWKKTSAYIRYHNWFADTLELDHTTANLPQFIQSLSADIRSGRWKSDKLRLVMAPKSHNWIIDEAGEWIPQGGNQAAKLRPLAHVSIRDQVAATAIMLCIADRVESTQGDPRPTKAKGPVLSYGNRLFCQQDDDGNLRHRWGSSKLYRGYFHDYQTFISKPEKAANDLNTEGKKVVIVQSDLSQFYDRVSAPLFKEKLRNLFREGDDPKFFDFADKVFSWSWHSEDIPSANAYGRAYKIPDFSNICLPQGLVAAGFFANVMLGDFDAKLAKQLGKKLPPNLLLHDVCRYVDDLRLVFSVKENEDLEAVRLAVTKWLSLQLSKTATDLLISDEKTTITIYGDSDRPTLQQRKRMARIQTAISGGFDVAGGKQIIERVQSLIRAQARLTDDTENGRVTAISPTPDVNSDTVNRFAAGRFRKTFRSLRPLLETSGDDTLNSSMTASPSDQLFHKTHFTRMDLDEEARTFAAGLIDRWILNPANVRLLRMGLDIWPAVDILKYILELLTPYTTASRNSKSKKIALYCLSEVFRAGATETGFVNDDDCLPDAIRIDQYRDILCTEANRVLALSSASTPWYLRQQALLFLTAMGPTSSTVEQFQITPETHRYFELISFLTKKKGQIGASKFATLAVIARRTLLGQQAAIDLIFPNLDTDRLGQISKRDPSFEAELIQYGLDEGDTVARKDFSNNTEGSLESVVSEKSLLNPLRNDIGVLSFARSFVKASIEQKIPAIICPADVLIDINMVGQYANVTKVRFKNTTADAPHLPFYEVPRWCEADDRWRIQLGFLLRYILSANIDFTKCSRTNSDKNELPLYRPLSSHWHQRIYGMYNGNGAFGDDWLAISESTQDLMFSLLAWPGCEVGNAPWVRHGLPAALKNLQLLAETAVDSIGEFTEALHLKISAPITNNPDRERPLRACIVQTVTPDPDDFKANPNDLTLSGPIIRNKHRNHLSTALAAVEKMLALRATHKNNDNRLDWLILPELAVHKDDVQTHLLPFARAHHTIILAGMVFEELSPTGPLINSAIWIIPTWTEERGLKTNIYRQGKFNLAPMEQKLNQPQIQIQGYRPCQWLVGYEWSSQPEDEPLWLTGAVCYDATDMSLAADLRDRSDVFAIPALNQDVGTFDQMALALHYHMYQMVVVANNGCYGGSNAYTPKKEQFVKQVFHSHGQPQASISFFEIEDIAAMKKRVILGKSGSKWKYPPAGI